jgi:hypothetical protein
MTEPGSKDPTSGNTLLHFLHRASITTCLVAMVVAFATLGTLTYQAWKLFHNPYKGAKVRAAAPSPEVAEWAAEIYRREKYDHMIFTSGLEVGLIALSAGAWFAYRRIDRHLKDTHRAKHPQPDRPRRSKVDTVPPVTNGNA